MKLETYHITLRDAAGRAFSIGDILAPDFNEALEEYDRGPGIAADTIKIEIVRVPS